MLQRLLLIVIAALLPIQLSLAEELPYECPLAVSVISGNGPSQELAEQVIPIYRELGCNTRFFYKPGQRNLVEFNQGDSDGELLRIRKAESGYTRSFVRSLRPIRVLYRGLWVHPEQHRVAGLPVGFQLGVIWQKRYAENINNSLRFYDGKTMLQAYSKEQLRGFLMAYKSEQQLLSNPLLKPFPILEVELPPLEVYHYLGAEFEPFMKRFSELYHSRYPQ